jgi:hypothetical protein
VEQRRVRLAVLAYSGMVHTATIMCLFNEILECLVKGWKVDYRFYVGLGLPKVRNTVVADFLADEFDDLVFIDDDVSWKPLTLQKLLSYPVDVVAGAYPFRQDPIRFPVALLMDRPELRGDPEHGLLEVASVPGGFLRLTRKCLDAMSWFYAKDRGYAEAATKSGRAVDLFPQLHRDGQMYGEDISFCMLWRDMGGKVWVDPDMELYHTGHKCFEGSLADWFRANQPKPAAQQVNNLDALTGAGQVQMSLEEALSILRSAA